MASFRHLVVGFLLVLGYFAGVPAHLWTQPLPQFVSSVPSASVPAAADRWQELAVSDGATRLVHAASMAELPDGRLRAVWFAGSREGAKDVAIHTSVFDPRLGRWSPESTVIDRAQLMAGLGRYVRKLGNAVLRVDADGRLRLYMVTVSFGGWGASRLSVITSDDLGESWSAPQLLVTSPFLNISTLAKGTPIPMTQGVIGLPVYHEFLGKFGELLQLDHSDRIVGKQRISRGRSAIQPVLLVASPTEAGALLRNTDRAAPQQLWFSETDDAGRSWMPLESSGFANSGSAVGAVVINPQAWLAVSNCNDEMRDDLCVQTSSDQGHSWQLLRWFHDRSATRFKRLAPQQLRAALQQELHDTAGVDDAERLLQHAVKNKCRHGNCEFQYDYPFMLRTQNGDVHIIYTWNKTMIRHLWWRAPASSSAATQERAQ